MQVFISYCLLFRLFSFPGIDWENTVRSSDVEDGLCRALQLFQYEINRITSENGESVFRTTETESDKVI